MRIVLPPKFKPLTQQRARFKVYNGGRGAAKSRSFGASLIDLSSKVPLRILCAREIQNSIKHSSKKLLEDEIKRQQLSNEFKITNTELVNLKTGSEFFFMGFARNIDSIKSIEGIDITWIEEGHSLSQESIDILFPSILRKEGSEIWISYNVITEEDPVHKMFVVNEPPPGSIVKLVNYPDNPFFPDELREQMEWMKETDYDKYLHIWMGEPLRHSEEQVYFEKWDVKNVPVPKKDTVFYHGLDFGFSTDPTAGVRCWESDDGTILYIDREAGGLRIENDDIVKVISNGIETFKEWPSYADNSRPETISHIKNKGFSKIKSCAKWPGCVEDGISFIRSYRKIVVDPRCKETIGEFGNYKYKKDKTTGDILPIIIDKNNHYMDALRYALGKKIKPRVKQTKTGAPAGFKQAIGY